MKKIIILASLVLATGLTSCRKDRTCECTTTYTSTTTPVGGQSSVYNPDPSTETKTYKKVKKSDIQVLCGNTKNSGSSSRTVNGVAASGSSSTSETKCKIK